MTYSHASKCSWDNDIPCVVIKPSINNSNALGDKITPTTVITKSEIEK